MILHKRSARVHWSISRIYTGINRHIRKFPQTNPFRISPISKVNIHPTPHTITGANKESQKPTSPSCSPLPRLMNLRQDPHLIIPSYISPSTLVLFTSNNYPISYLPSSKKGKTYPAKIRIIQTTSTLPGRPYHLGLADTNLMEGDSESNPKEDKSPSLDSSSIVGFDQGFTTARITMEEQSAFQAQQDEPRSIIYPST